MKYNTLTQSLGPDVRMLPDFTQSSIYQNSASESQIIEDWGCRGNNAVGNKTGHLEIAIMSLGLCLLWPCFLIK